MSGCVVVTGVGSLSAAGPDAQALYEAVSVGGSCLGLVQDPRYKPTQRVMAGFVKEVPDISAVLPAGWPAPDRFGALALVAAQQAIAQAQLDPAGLGTRMGVMMGTCSGPTTALEQHYLAMLHGACDRSPEQAFRLSYDSAVRLLAWVFGIQGPSGTVTTACSAGSTAVGMCLDLIRCGMCDAALVGGADAFNISTQIGFDGLKAPSDGACSPFSTPVGLCLGEGSAFLVLESLAHARSRGATVLGVILGFGTSNDAYHSSAPDPTGRGQALAVARALENAGVASERVVYVNAHGTGTSANDKAETKVVRRVFGAEADAMSVSSQKAVFGHTLGAAGAIELAGALQCCNRGVLPPTANFSDPREGCDLDYVREPGRAFPADRLWVKENFAFGGHNAALVLGTPAAADEPLAKPVPSRRICVAGIGLVTSAGAGREPYLRLLGGGDLALSSCEATGHPAIRAALVPESVDAALERRLGLRRMDKATSIGAISAYHALAEAGISLRPDALAAVGLFMGHASGSNAAESVFLPELLQNDYVLQKVTEFTQVVPNATAGGICRALGLRGHNASFCFGEGAGLPSLLMAACALQNGHGPYVLAGSVDVLTERGWGHFLPASDVPLAEGAIFFLLEEESHIRARGGHALAVIEGMAWETRHSSFPEDPSELAERQRATAAAALSQAGFDPQEAGHAFDVVRGVSAGTGWAEASQPLFDIAGAILPDAPGTGFSRPLLHTVSARQGMCFSIVFTPFEG